jgi:alkylhydroperoxidase family enzyme
VDPDTTDSAIAPLFAPLKERKIGPFNFHRTIAQAPEIYKAFNVLSSAVRFSGKTPRVERELIILKVTSMQNGEYEFIQHKRIAMSCGLSEDKIAHIADWKTFPGFSEREKGILELGEGLVKDMVTDGSRARLLKIFSPQELVELSMNAGFYSSVVQFSHALGIPPETTVTAYAGC